MSEPVEFFFSFRSPYSYLAAPRAFALADRHPVEVRYRGVIPMAMRGQAVPRAKQLHTLRDVTREARRLGMPFGPLHDPIGEGALRCLLVGEHAARVGRARELVLRVSRAIWSEAADVRRDRVLRALCEDAGLRWPDCAAALHDDELRARVAENTNALAALGQWGVPVLVLRGEPFWGQDRLDDVAAALRGVGVPVAPR